MEPVVFPQVRGSRRYAPLAIPVKAWSRQHLDQPPTGADGPVARHQSSGLPLWAPYRPKPTPGWFRVYTQKAGDVALITSAAAPSTRGSRESRPLPRRIAPAGRHTAGSGLSLAVSCAFAGPDDGLGGLTAAGHGGWPSRGGEWSGRSSCPARSSPATAAPPRYSPAWPIGAYRQLWEATSIIAGRAEPPPSRISPTFLCCRNDDLGRGTGSPKQRCPRR